MTGWSPRVDGQFVPMEPVDAMKGGTYQHIPWIVGLTDDEGAYKASALFSDDKSVEEFNTGLATNELGFRFVFRVINKSVIGLVGKAMAPESGNTILTRSFQQLHLSRSQTLEGLFQLTQCPKSPRMLLQE